MATVHGNTDSERLARETFEAVTRSELKVTWIGRRSPIRAALAELGSLAASAPNSIAVSGPFPTDDGRGVVVAFVPAGDGPEPHFPTIIYWVKACGPQLTFPIEWNDDDDVVVGDPYFVDATRNPPNRA